MTDREGGKFDYGSAAVGAIIAAGSMLALLAVPGVDAWSSAGVCDPQEIAAVCVRNWMVAVGTFFGVGAAFVALIEWRRRRDSERRARNRYARTSLFVIEVKAEAGIENCTCYLAEDFDGFSPGSTSAIISQMYAVYGALDDPRVIAVLDSDDGEASRMRDLAMQGLRQELFNLGLPVDRFGGVEWTERLDSQSLYRIRGAFDFALGFAQTVRTFS